MPSVMLRKGSDGKISFYVAKKDLEETIVSVERDDSDTWGGTVELSDGSKYYIDPMTPPPELPTTMRFKRC